MIVKNEAAILTRCLRSVKEIADEIVVVDTGSIDDTASIAREHGATVVFSEWKNDFSRARNISLRKASGQWLLWLDADDVIPRESIDVINNLKTKTPDTVFGFIVRNEKHGQTGSEFIQARMLPNRPDIYFQRRIHEQMMLSALRAGLRLTETAAIIEHHGYADPSTMRVKARRNIGLLLEEYGHGNPDAVMAVEIGDSYSILGETDNAQKWYETALNVPGCEDQAPHLAGQAHLGLGNHYNKNGDFEEAIGHLQKALRLSPNRPDVQFSLAVALDLSGRKQEAIDCLYAVIRQEPVRLLVGIDFREARIKSFLRLERLLMECRKNDEAFALAGEALARMAHRPEIHNMAGRIFYRCNRLMDALHAFEKSLLLDVANNIDAYVGLCQIYFRAGKLETARQTVQSIRTLYKEKPRYWALYRQCIGETADAEIPASVDITAISGETEHIHRLYQP